MAGDWIKIQHVTPDKPEVYQLAAHIGVTPEDAFGRCVRVWIWADQQSLNGHALTVTNVTLDAISRRDGFGTALCKVGWLIDNGDGTVTFPNFDRHNGETAKTRATAGDRKKKQREKHSLSVTEMSRDDRDKSVTREEKRRVNSKPPKSPATPDGFAEFWAIYPRKIGKGAAEKAFAKARINGQLSTVIAAIKTQAASDQWLKDNGQYIPNPATWINQRRWEDGEVATPKVRERNGRTEQYRDGIGWVTV